MAGRRKRADHTGAPRERYWARLKQAKDEGDQLAAAFDFFRLVLRKCAKDTSPEQRKAIVTTVIAGLVGPAEELLTRHETRGRQS